MDQHPEIARNAIAAQRKAVMDQYQRYTDMKWIDNRMEDGRMARFLSKVAAEAAMEKEYQERTDHASIVNAQARKEIDLAMAIAEHKRQEINAYQRRHVLRENDESLKLLKRKLEAGYVCRDLQLQIQNNEYKKLQEKAEDRRAREMLEKAVYSDQEAYELEFRAKKDQEFKYGQEVRQQMALKQLQKQSQYEDTLVEKKMLDGVLKTITDEDQRELQCKRELAEKLRCEMKTFAIAKKAWQEKHKALIAREEEEIEKQQKQLKNRDATVISERKRRTQEKEKFCDKMAHKIMSEEEEKNRRENIIRLLQEQELLEKNLQEDLQDKLKLERVKRETKESLLEQMEVKKKLAREEKDREYRYLQQLREEARLESEREKEKNALIRQKNKQHCEHLLKQAEEQRNARRVARAGDEMLNKAVFAAEEAWSKEVAGERAKIIRGHVPSLLGYLQPGVLCAEDLPVIKEGAAGRPELAGLSIDALVNTQHPKNYPKCNLQCRNIRDY